MSDPSCRIGAHTLFLGPCEEWLETLPAESVDVICTSPPYNLQVRYGDFADDLPEGEYTNWLAGICRQLARVLKPDGSFFLNLGSSNKKPWIPFVAPIAIRGLLDDAGKPLWTLQNSIKWVKAISVGQQSFGQFKPINSPRYITPTSEDLLHFTRRGATPLNRLALGVPYADKSNLARFGAKDRPDLRCRGNVWFLPYETVQTKAGKFDHPATFPITLPQWAIRLHGVADPVVLDPFMGTGTTVGAAIRERGRGLGIERDATHYQTAVQRIRAMVEADDEQLGAR